MTNFERMTALDAVKWYEATRAELRTGFDVETIERFLALDIVDTDLMLEFARGTVLDDLDKVPGLDPTPENLRKLAIIGPDVMRRDPDNVDEWIAVAQKYVEDGEDPHVVLVGFLDAGRAPSFARQVLELIERTNADASKHKPKGWIDGNTVRTKVYWDVDDLDLTQPYAVLADMVQGGLTEADRAKWAEAGYDLADAVKLRGDGLTIGRINVLKHHGVPRDRWADYSGIPSDWIDHDREWGTGKPRELPEGITLDLLTTLARDGWQRQDLAVPGSRRYSRLRPDVWQVFYDAQPVDLTPEQIERLLAAKLTNHTVSKYYLEGRSGGSVSHAADSPPPLIANRPRYIDAPPLDDFITEVIQLAAAKVRPSHLTTYRWVGCKSFAEVREAAAAGISEVRAKHLRATYGRKHGYGHSATRRIDSLAALLEFDRTDREPAATGTE